jgi:hypothetical protein
MGGITHLLPTGSPARELLDTGRALGSVGSHAIPPESATPAYVAGRRKIRKERDSGSEAGILACHRRGDCHPPCQAVAAVQWLWSGGRGHRSPRLPRIPA